MKEMDPTMSFRTAGVATMLAQCNKVARHMPGALSGEDPDDLRRMRVATRRLRAAMKVFRACFPPQRYERWYKRVSELTDALGLVRDVDVQAELIARHRSGLPPEHQEDINRLLSAHRHRREEARARLAATLEHWEEKDMLQRLQRLIATTGGMVEPIARRAAEIEMNLLGHMTPAGPCEATGEDDDA